MKNDHNADKGTKIAWMLPGIFGVVTVFLGWVFFAQTLVPHLQMRAYVREINEAVSGNDPQPILNDTFIFKGSNYAQEVLRATFLNAAFSQTTSGGPQASTVLLDAALKKVQDYMSIHTVRADYYLGIAKSDDVEASIDSNPLLLIYAEQNYEAALALVPGRQDIMYPFANNLLKLGLDQESIAVLQQAIAETPTVPEGPYRLGEEYAVMGTATYDQSLSELEIALNSNFNPDAALVKQIYDKFLEYYYQQSDVAHFKIVLARLILINPSEASAYTTVLNYIQTNGVMPTINIVASN